MHELCGVRMNLKIVCYILPYIALNLFINLFAQSLTFKGIVVDSKTNQPIENVNVFLIGEKESTTTNPKGEFYFKGLLGKINLKFTHISYNTRSLSFELSGLRPDSVKIIKLTSANIPLKDVYIVSTRNRERYSESALPLEVITKDEIQKHQPQTVAEIISKKPGLSLQRDGIWATSISIRGLKGADVITLIDGNRIETATDLDGALSLYNLDDIKQIEVIKNASSVLYGTGALGGIINIITDAAHYSNGFRINGRINSGFGTVNKSLTNSAEISLSDRNWILTLNGSYRKAENTQTPSGELLNSGYNDDYISGKLKVFINENSKLSLSYQNFKGWDIGIPGGSGLFPGNAVVKYSFIKRDLFDIQYSIKNIIDPLKDLTIKFYNQNIYRFVENIPNQTKLVSPANGNPEQIITVDRITPGARHYVTGLQLQSNWLFGNNLLLAGIDAWQRNLDSRREKRIIHSERDPQSNQITEMYQEIIGEKPLPNSSFRSIGLYVQDEFSMFSEKLKITVGGRTDQIFVKNDSISNPVYYFTIPERKKNKPASVLNWDEMNIKDYSWSSNINLLYYASPNINLTFSYSHSFRSASLEERYKYIDLGSLIRIGNPLLNPEKGNYFDGGIRILNDNFNFYGNIFINFLTDQIIELPGTFEGRKALLTANARKSRLYGFDCSADFNISDNSLISISAAYVRGQDISKNTDLPEIPPFNGRINYRLNIPELLSFELSANIFSSQSDIAPGELSTPGYVYYNLYINSKPVKILDSNFRVTAGCENITNKSYRNHLSTNRGMIISEPGRNFFLKISLNF